MKKLLALAVAMLMVLSMSGIAEIATEGLPISDEVIELTAVGAVSEIQKSYNDMVILQNFAEASNVHITFQDVQNSDRVEQLSLMLASGEVPDILFKMAVSATDQAKYAEEGMFVAISDYAEYAPNLYKWFAQYPTAQAAVTQADGKIYAAPYILGDAIRVGGKYWFNTDLMEKIGYDAIPTTIDGLIEFLTAARDFDYNGNGEADEIPISASELEGMEATFYGSFGLENRGSTHSQIMVDDEGVVQYAFATENYKNLLGFFRTLYAEKLLDQDIFTMDYAQLIAKAQTGRALTYIFTNNSPVVNSEYEQYTLGITEPFEGPNGEKQWPVYSLPASTDGNLMITYKCAEKGEDAVKAAVRWMDHWYSDEGITEFFMGIKDVTYVEDETAVGGVRYSDMVMNDPNGQTFEQVLASYVPWAGGRNPSVATDEYFKGGETWPVCLESIAGLRNYMIPDEQVWTAFSAYYTAEEASEMSSIKADLDTYRKEWRANFVTGQKDLDADWDEYVAGFDGVNLPRYMELYRAAAEKYLADHA